jgi:YVTN family beta-propeller protein
MRGIRVGVAAAALVFGATVASTASTTSIAGQARAANPLSFVTSESRLDRMVAARLLTKSLLATFPRSAGSIANVPVRSGLVKGTIGNPNLGETVIGFGKMWVIDQPWRMVRGLYHANRARALSIDLRTHRMVGKPIAVGRGAWGIGAGGGSVWVVNADDATVTRIDPRSRRVVATIPVGGRNLGRMIVTHGMVWVLRDDYDKARGWELIRIDPATNKVVGRTPLGKNMCGGFGIAAAKDALWISADAQGSVIRIDPVTGRLVTRIKIKGAPIGPVVAHGAVWVANEAQGPTRVWRIDPATNGASPMRDLAGDDSMLEPRAGRFWTTDGATIRMIDPATGAVELAMILPNTYNFEMKKGTLWGVAWDSVGTASVQWVDLTAGLRTLDPPPSLAT